MKLILLLVMKKILLFNVVFTFVTPKPDPVAKLDQGLIKGVWSDDGNYSMFLGVPYAEVDMANPFGPALPPSNVSGVYEAYHGTVQCPQVSTDGVYTGTLNCLQLNIFVPSDATKTNLVPVLIWIHGGNFSSGSIAESNPKQLVAEGIIVVTINYRLGPYGFMCLDIPSVPGNQGLKDQDKAIEWVKSNIAAFGGNPKRITLAGQGAGSASALYHLYSDKEKHYHQVIAQSGTPLTEGMFVAEKHVQAAIKIASFIGAQTPNTDVAMVILNQAYPDLVVIAANKLNLVLRPCTETAFSGGDDAMITKDPFKLSNDINKNFISSIMIGHTSKERIRALKKEYGHNYLKKDPFYKKIKENFRMNLKDVTRAAELVRNFYIGDEELSPHLISVLEDFDSDFVYSHPVHRTVTNLLQKQSLNIYQYMFSYTSDSKDPGAGHSAELEYLFHTDEAMNRVDQIVAQHMKILWTNFVKYGSPTPISKVWKPVSRRSRYYLNLDSEPKMKRRVFKERMAFWDLFYELYRKYHVFNTKLPKIKVDRRELVFLRNKNYL